MDLARYVLLYAYEHDHEEGWWRIAHLFGYPMIQYIIEENNLDTRTKAVAHFVELVNVWNMPHPAAL